MQNWKISEEEIDSIINSIVDTDKEYVTEFGSATIVAWILPNGYTISEISGCVNPEQFDMEIGKKNCRAKLKTKLWELEGYLHKQMYFEAMEG